MIFKGLSIKQITQSFWKVRVRLLTVKGAPNKLKFYVTTKNYFHQQKVNRPAIIFALF